MNRFQRSASGNQKLLRSVVVTGVSSGIGAGIARVLASAGLRVYGSVRNPDDAARLEHELGDKFCPLYFDLTDDRSIERAAESVHEAQLGSTLLGLVNNAGIMVAGPLLEVPMDDFRRQIETNLCGTMQVIRAFAPVLGTDTRLRGAPGRIVNVTSVCGRIGLPFVGAYAASKHALEGLSESLRRELMPYGIDVIIVGPGAVDSPMWDKTMLQEGRYQEGSYSAQGRRFKEFMLGRKKLSPEQIGRVVLSALVVSRPKVRYAVVARPLRDWILPRVLPRRLIDYYASWQFDLKRHESTPAR